MRQQLLRQGVRLMCQGWSTPCPHRAAVVTSRYLQPILQHKPNAATGKCYYGVRWMSAVRKTSAAIVSKDYIIRSPVEDIEIPNITVHEQIFKSCDQHKDKVALDDYLTGRTLTFAQVKEQSIKAANALSKMGFKKGDIITAFSINSPDFSILMLACSILGVWFSAANPLFTPGELRTQLIDSKSKAVFATNILTGVVTEALDCPELKECVQHRFSFGPAEGYSPFSSLVESGEAVMPEVSINPKEDIYALPYSSGTTGLPKGVLLTHYNIVANINQLVSSVEMKEDDVFLGLLPMYHIYGMVPVQYAAMSSGARLVLLPKFEPESFLKCIQEKKINFANLVPPLVVFMAKHPVTAQFDLSSLETVISAAAPLGPQLTEEFVKKFPHTTLLQAYGLTEAAPAVNFEIAYHPGTCGRLIANTLGRFVDLETKQNVAPGQEGEYWIRGPQVMRGFYNRPSETAAMLDSEGWLHTGDIGYYTEDGNVVINDRVKELIKYKGFQVAPAELESVLLTHPSILDVAVIGIPDERAGELPKAFVVQKPGTTATEEEILKFVEDRVAPSKQLRGGVSFIKEIPKNPSGKILRRVLKAQNVQQN